jgi:hypothetical protein
VSPYLKDKIWKGGEGAVGMTQVVEWLGDPGLNLQYPSR